MQGMRIKIGKGKTLKFNLAITKSFNADFDGDEMNIYVPQTLESQVEVKNLMVATNNIMSKQTGNPLVGVVQDACLGAYLMTKYDLNIDAETFNDIVMEIRFTHAKKEEPFDLFSKLEKIERILRFKKKPYRKYSGKTLLSLILPNYFSLKTNTIEIYDGVICSGFIDKKTMNDIVKVVHNTFSNLHAADLIDNVQYVTRGYLLRFGFTIDLGDCQTTCQSQVNDAVEEYLSKARFETDESSIVSCLNNAKNKGQKITKDSLKLSNHFFDTILSGSKGDFSNVTQIMGLLGQQNLKCGRPSDSLRHLYKDEFEKRGFIRGSFMKGLNPLEFWYHAMSGREGVCDTSVNTSTSGYIQRKLVKNLEDVMVYDDGTVRNHMGNIFQTACEGTKNGERVGLICAQSIREGASKGIPRVQELLNVSKSPKNIFYTVRLKPEVSFKVKDLKAITVKSFVKKIRPVVMESYAWRSVFHKLFSGLDEHEEALEIETDRTVLFENDITPFDLVKKIPSCEIDPQMKFLYVPRNTDLNTLIKGDVDFVNVERKDDCELTIETRHKRFLKILTMEMTDFKRTRSSNVWDVYETLGIEAAREYLLQEFLAELPDIRTNHFTLLTDKMTFTGDIFSVNRYSTRKENIGVFAKASFEESFDHFVNAAVNEETDNTKGLSAGIICGKL